MNLPRPLAVIGPTAAGKTSFALVVAAQLLEKGVVGVDLISADSRQVYRGLEVLTGADLPVGFEQIKLRDLPHPVWQNQAKSINLHGVSIIPTQQEWSLGHFVKFGRAVIGWSAGFGRAVIVVGGTGLYQQKLFSSSERVFVAPNQELRARAEAMTVKQLQVWLEQLDPNWLGRMHHSDLNNPRRLVRVIELASQTKGKYDLAKNTQLDHYTVGISSDLEQLEQKIKARVAKRFVQAKQEVVVLLKAKLPINGRVMSSLGVQELVDHLAGKTTRQECQQLWSLHELQYAKRQRTWWRKHQPDLWLSNNDKVDTKEEIARICYSIGAD